MLEDFKSHDVESRCEDKVVEEVVDDELQVDESGPARYQHHQQQLMTVAPMHVPPQPYVNFSPPALASRHYTNDHLCPAVDDHCCSMPVKVVDVDVVGKSSEQ